MLAIVAAIDLALDHPKTLWSFHVLVEISLLVLCAAAVVYLWRGWRRAGRSVERMREALEAHASERDAWRARAEKLLLGLGAEIESQLRTWGLTPAEQETALFLLKGFGHKEIAEIQGKSERTVRQHAIAVYRKSGLGGRAELSAFFLEDLLLPAMGSSSGSASAEPPFAERNGVVG